MASQEQDPIDPAGPAGSSQEAQDDFVEGSGGHDRRPDIPPPTLNVEEKQFRLKLALFWGIVIAAMIAAFATGYPGWENYIAQEAAKRQLRAYIDVRPKGMKVVEEGVTPRVHDSFHNIGRTPAYDNGSFSRIVVTEYPLTHKLANDECRPVSPAPKGNKWFIGKASRQEIAREAAFTAGEVESIKGGKTAVYFHGNVCYRDIFNEVHRTDFCLYWKWDAGRLGPGLYCDKGNSTG